MKSGTNGGRPLSSSGTRIADNKNNNVKSTLASLIFNRVIFLTRLFFDKLRGLAGEKPAEKQEVTGSITAVELIFP